MSKLTVKASSIRLTMILLLIISFVLSVGGFYHVQKTLRDRAADLNLNNPLIVAPITSTDKTSLLTTSPKDFVKNITMDLDKYEESISPGMITSYDTSKAVTGEQTLSTTNIKIQPVTITLKNPVKYTNFVKLVKAIETNLPKMSIKNLTVKRNLLLKGYVDVEPITIEVYVK